jgi:cobalt/nickel transport system permease protein
MHIPDGYLSPVFSLSAGVATIPAWALAAQRVRTVLNHRTIPLLAIFSAFIFTIMMFNIPVPGGTTAHAVGGTLLAIVLGPWAAILGVSTALIIQALFFGDGGVLAIFANCFNMGVLLPFTGYYTYRLIAGNAPVLSTRRIWAAGIGAYAGITVAGLAVGIELGVQPLLFSQNGQALYSPYPLEQAIPAMLLTHLFGAALVEGLVTALGIAYMQKNHSEFFISLRSTIAGPLTVKEQDASSNMQDRLLWLPIMISVIIVFAALFVIGLIDGKGDIAHLFGTDWSQVDWSAVASMLLFVAVFAAILIPLAWFLLPRSLKKIGTGFVTAAVIAPLGLIAPGFAYGEGAPEDVQAAFGYVPKGLEQFSSFFSAPLADYNIPLPFFSDASAPLWHAAIGYEISGILGILILGLLMLGIGYVIHSLGDRSKLDTPTVTKETTP